MQENTKHSKLSAREMALIELQKDTRLTFKKVVAMAKAFDFDLPEMIRQMDGVIAKTDMDEPFIVGQFEEELEQIFEVMDDSVRLGLAKDSDLETMPGDYAARCYSSGFFDDLTGVALWAGLATNYHSARQGTIAPAPTCGSAGVFAGTLYAYKTVNNESSERLLDALKVGALGGLVAFKRGSVSGAKGGCGAEIGVATMMAAMASAWLLDCDTAQIGHAAALAGTMFPGLECSPSLGRVEYPCILRNGFAANIAIVASKMAKAGMVPPFDVDEVLIRIFAAGACLPVELRETNSGPWMSSIVARYLTGATSKKCTMGVLEGGKQ